MRAAMAAMLRPLLIASALSSLTTSVDALSSASAASPSQAASKVSASSPSASPRNLLVLGGAGYVGREICAEAVSKGWSVTSLSRRGENPRPEIAALCDVKWMKGDIQDGALLRSLVADADAVVHAVGMLFDDRSGLGTLNLVTSGSRSKVEKGATYEAICRDSALDLLAAAKEDAGGRCRTLLYVSAAEAGWSELPNGDKLNEGVPEWLQRYLSAKRDVEAAYTSASLAASEVGTAKPLRTLLARPSIMWSYNKLDVLPLVPLLALLSALKVGDGAFNAPLRVNEVAAACVAALEQDDLSGPVPIEKLQQLTPLSATMRPTAVDVLTSGLASITRLPYGTNVASDLTVSDPSTRGLPDASQLRLYEFEGCPFCRRVRETITYLDLEVMIMPCGRNSRHRADVEQAAAKAGLKYATFPYLVDDAAGVSMFESKDIVNHLLDTYGQGAPLPPPSDYFFPSTLTTGWMPTLLRLGKGGSVHPRAAPSRAVQPLTLYSYDGNQFCRLVREALVELDLPYTLRSVGKGSPRRQQLASLAGKSTAPFLSDPNTGISMFESADIVSYLWRTYTE